MVASICTCCFGFIIVEKPTFSFIVAEKVNIGANVKAIAGARDGRQASAHNIILHCRYHLFGSY